MIVDGMRDLMEVNRRDHLWAATVTPYTRTRFLRFGVEIEVVQPHAQVVYFRPREEKRA